MNLAEKAYYGLFPDKLEDRTFEVSYSGKFKDFNANVKYTASYIKFSLSREWLEFSEDLRIGLIQHLLVRVFSRRKYEKTFELDLYLKFMDNVGKYTKVEHDDYELSESYERINAIYFDGFMEKPNLKWGQDAFSKLGHYEYASNTVVISNIFKDEPEQLDYIMHHELLHKKHGNKVTKTGRNIHHSREFKRDEAKYHDKDAEKNLNKFLRRKKFKKALWF